MSQRCVTNVSVGSWYPRGQDRLRRSLSDVGFDGNLLLWSGEYPPGCPTHQEQPYAFKVAALEMAIHRGMGATLWCDGSVWFIRDPSPLFKQIEENGYWIMTLGWCTSEWCMDSALPLLGVKRDDYWSVPMISATMFGFDMQSDIARKVVGYMRARVRDGSLRGPWTNEQGQASLDKRVLGHRHDQTALSVIAHKLGLNIEWHPNYLEYKWPDSVPNPKCVALAQGM